MFRVVEAIGNEDVELIFSNRFKGLDVFVTEPRRDLNSVALESSKEVSIEGFEFVLQFFNEVLCFLIEGDDDWNLPVIDETEIFCCRCKIKSEGEFWIVRIETEVLQDGFRVPALALPVVVEVKVVVNGFLREEIGVEVEKLIGDLRGFAEVGFGVLIFRLENVSASGLIQFTVSIAASRCLGDGIESGESAEDGREIDIDARFDELSGDDAGGEIFDEARPDSGENLTPMLGAHERREVVVLITFTEELINFLSMFASVHDTERLLLLL